MFKEKYAMMGIPPLYLTVRVIALDLSLDIHAQEEASHLQEPVQQYVEME